MNEKFSMLIEKHQTENDKKFSREMEVYFDDSIGTNVDKLRNFTKFVPRQNLSNFLAKYEIYKKLINLHGNIIECGVFLGGGLMTWAQLSAIFEPYNHVRKITGFDTFTGFTGITDQDKSLSNPHYVKKGGLATDAVNDLEQCIQLFDLNRPIGHIPRVELVVGDAVAKIPEYVKENQHLVVAMLYLDFDLYEPTKVAIETFLPRMPKGAILAFDELNQSAWPGETLAVLNSMGIRNLRIQRFPFTPQLSYALLD